MWPEKHRPCQLSGWSSPPWWHVWMVMDPAIKVVPHASGWPVSLGWSPSLAPLFPLGANMGSIVFVEQAPSPGLHRLFCLCGGHAGEEMDGFRPRDLAVPSPAFTTSTLDSLGPATSPRSRRTSSAGFSATDGHSRPHRSQPTSSLTFFPMAPVLPCLVTLAVIVYFFLA